MESKKKRVREREELNYNKFFFSFSKRFVVGRNFESVREKKVLVFGWESKKESIQATKNNK